MELSNYNLAQQADVGFTFEITHPATGEKLGGFVTVRGDESKTIQTYNRKKLVEFQKRQNQNKAKDLSYTPAEYEDMNIEAAIVRVISWKNIKTNGDDLPFTKENADMLFREYPWIRDQVMEASRDLLNFQPSGT